MQQKYLKFGFDCVINAIFIMIYKYINAQTTDVYDNILNIPRRCFFLQKNIYIIIEKYVFF